MLFDVFRCKQQAKTLLKEGKKSQVYAYFLSIFCFINWKEMIIHPFPAAGPEVFTWRQTGGEKS